MSRKEAILVVHDAVQSGPLKIHLGSNGNVKRGYLNVDFSLPITSKVGEYTYVVNLEALDFLNLVPLEMVAEIRSQFFLEHLTPFALYDFFTLCNMVLQKSGKMVHETDNFSRLIEREKKVVEEFDFYSYVSVCNYLFGSANSAHYGSYHKSFWTEEIFRWWFNKYEFIIQEIKHTPWDSMIITATKGCLQV